ncbi:MAG: hypothetical protein ACLSGK_10185 [Lachnospiraceae bacterium]
MEKCTGEKDALHEISKELFLEKMKEWESGGRRTAERRVGDEEMEEENNRILVVKSDEKWMKCNIIAVIEIGVCWMVSIISGDVIFIVFLGILLSTISLWILWSEGKVLILDETGCTVKFLKYKKYMKWDEIETKQLRVIWECITKGYCFPGARKNLRIQGRVIGMF